MINKGLFKTSLIGGKPTFVQVRNYEICKYIYSNFSNDKTLVFKLPKELNSDNSSLFQTIEKYYESDINLELQSAVHHAIVPYLYKQKNR